MPEHIVTLSVGGSEYFGWLSVSITSDLEAIARKFDVSLTRRKDTGINASFGNILPIKLGDDVVVKIDGSPVVTGYISRVSVEQSHDNLSISISGVSLTGVLNDCTAPDVASKSFKQQRVGDIIKNLADLYKIVTKDNLENKDKKDFTLAVDKTIGSAITDIQKNTGIIVTDNEQGNLVIINKKNMILTPGVLAVGDNVLSASRTSDLSSRFKKYVAIGQGKNPKGSEATTNGPKAYAEDVAVSRDRVKVFKINGSVTQDILQNRVDLTRDYLSGAGESIEYEVPGWYDQANELWKVGTKISVKDDLSTGKNVSVIYVIKSVNYVLDGNGTRTKITVKPETAYTGTDYTSASQAVEKSAKDKAAQAKKTGGKDAKSSAKQTGKNNWVLKSGSGQIK